jgi:hypothetical protein
MFIIIYILKKWIVVDTMEGIFEVFAGKNSQGE